MAPDNKKKPNDRKKPINKAPDYRSEEWYFVRDTKAIRHSVPGAGWKLFIEFKILSTRGTALRQELQNLAKKVDAKSQKLDLEELSMQEQKLGGMLEEIKVLYESKKLETYGDQKSLLFLTANFLRQLNGWFMWWASFKECLLKSIESLEKTSRNRGTETIMLILESRRSRISQDVEDAVTKFNYRFDEVIVFATTIMEARKEVTETYVAREVRDEMGEIPSPSRFLEHHLAIEAEIKKRLPHRLEAEQQEQIEVPPSMPAERTPLSFQSIRNVSKLSPPKKDVWEPGEDYKLLRREKGQYTFEEFNAIRRAREEPFGELSRQVAIQLEQDAYAKGDIINDKNVYPPNTFELNPKKESTSAISPIPSIRHIPGPSSNNARVGPGSAPRHQPPRESSRVRARPRTPSPIGSDGPASVYRSTFGVQVPPSPLYSPNRDVPGGRAPSRELTGGLFRNSVRPQFPDYFCLSQTSTRWGMRPRAQTSRSPSRHNTQRSRSLGDEHRSRPTETRANSR